MTGVDRTTTGLLAGGVLAGPLFLTTALVEGARRPGYRPRRHPVSSLALGPGGLVQTANFLVAGTLYGGAAIGLARSAAGGNRAVPILVGAAAVGLVGAGAFTTDPVNGYPPGTPDQLTERSTSGLLHDLLSVPTFLGLPAAAVLDAWRSRRQGRKWWALYSAKSAVVALGAFGLASAGFGQEPHLVDRSGVFQRIFVGTAFGWLTALCARGLFGHGS